MCSLYDYAFLHSFTYVSKSMQKNAIDVGGIKEKQNNFCVAINHINAEISTKGEGMILCRIMF